MNEEKMCDEFRAWLLEVDLLRDRQGLVPITGREANLMEKAWQASRAALVIELPDSFSPNDCGDWAYWAELVDKAIEAAGVRVK